MDSKAFKYEQVVKSIEDLISSLELKPGDKIPSVRKLSETLNVSITTVFQAYNILEARGLIQSKPKSGYYVSNSIKKIEPFNIIEKGYIPLPVEVEINEMATTMMRNSRENGVLNFSILSPVNEFLPITRLNKAVSNALREMSSVNFQYPLVEGDPKILYQLSLQTISWPTKLSKDQILVTNGAMEAINLCLDAIAEPGDVIAVESPTYHGILQSLETRKLKVLEVPTNPFTGIILDELEKLLENNSVKACVFMPRTSNPTGASMPEESKKILADLLGSKNIPLIEDDTLGELQFFNSHSLPVKAYDNYNNVLYCSSVSKTLAPGFRIGWVSGSKFHKKIEKLKFGANISTTGVFQNAIGKYFESGQYPSHIRKMSISVQCQVNKYIDAIQKHFPSTIRIAEPAAGFSLWIELPKEIDSIELQREALANGIGLCPGYIFSMTGMYNNFIRINCCPLWSFKVENGIKKIGGLIKKMMS